MTVENCGCGGKPAKVVKDKVSVGYVQCECGCVGPTVSCETHDEADIEAVEAWNAVRKRTQEHDGKSKGKK